MTPRQLLLFLVITLCGGTAFAAPLNLVTNGSFEQGTLGIGSFQGWQTTIPDANTFVDSSGQTGTHYGQATDGKWAAYFGTPRGSGSASISQSFATVSGQFYTLAFDLANDTGGLAPSNAFSAYINSIALFTAGSLANQDFIRTTLTFQATGAFTTLRFTGYNDQSYAELDNVTVTAATPEPSPLLLLGTGLVACLGMVWLAQRDPTARVN